MSPEQRLNNFLLPKGILHDGTIRVASRVWRFGRETRRERGDNMAQQAKNPPATQEPEETPVQSLGQEDPLEEGLATHSDSCLDSPMNRGA